jgi:hypothetical protein
MQNDEHRPSKFDPFEEGVILGAMGWWAMLPSFTFPSQVLDRLARQKAPRAASDWRDERLARAAYLSIVGIERLARAVASLVRRVGRYVAQQLLLRRQTGAQPECKPTETVTQSSST